MIRSQMARSS